MSTAICTLFEGSYHLGLVGLSNSLYKSGFRGVIYAGYRGSFPSWASSATSYDEKNWPGSRLYKVRDDFSICFLPLTTTYHLTNYKPDFMLEIIRNADTSLEELIYMDPDIVITAPWHQYQKWMKCGIAVCEDVNSPLQQNHPKRVAWREFYSSHNIELNFKSAIYVNGGFVGVSKKSFEFLETWKRVQEYMAEVIGGLEKTGLKKGNSIPESLKGNFSPFNKTDQDALNVSLEVTNCDISYLGKEAMTFGPGMAIMRHALGLPKPWDAEYLKILLNGNSPKAVDRDYWNAVTSPIAGFSNSKVKLKKLTISTSAFLSRFYQRRNSY